MDIRPASDARWIYDSPIYSDVEAKLRHFLFELGNADKIVGVQVCAYKDGKVIIDTAAGVLAKGDPHPVQPDSLFPVFSVTKGVVSGMIHWLADKGKLKLDENVANNWPEFATNGKDQIKVNHILNHTSGLHNALVGTEGDPKLFGDWNGCLRRIAMATPETEPGHQQLYHYLSYGWLCGGIIEHASGKKFQDILQESFVKPLNVEGELYIGIPPGVESRLATLTIDANDLHKLDPESNSGWTIVPSALTLNSISNLIALLNSYEGRCAILPAAGGHFTARAVARYYATLVDGGVVPPRHPSISQKEGKREGSTTNNEVKTKIFTNPKEEIHDAFLGNGNYKNLAIPNGIFGLGFHRYHTTDGTLIGFGHSGLGGCAAYCDINNKFAIAVTLNKLSTGVLTGEIIRFICLELDLPIPQEFAGSSETGTPVIN